MRNESAEDFLLLLKEWEQLCASCSLLKSNTPTHPLLKVGDANVEDDDEGADDDDGGSGDEDEGEIFEVEEILEVCYGDPKEIKKPGLYFKVFVYCVWIFVSTLLLTLRYILCRLL